MSEAGAGRSRQRPMLRSEFRIVRDFFIGLVVYVAIVLATALSDGRDVAAQSPMFSSSARAAAPIGLLPAGAGAGETAAESQMTSTEKREAIAILGLAFATLVAFDLALFRHLRRVYASPR